MRRHRPGHPLWYAHLAHRLSGLLLVLFLPAHFLVLALAVTAPASLDGFLMWTERPLVRAAEAVLVFLFALHVLGGMRLLLLEMLAYTRAQKLLAGGAAALALVLAGIFVFAGA